MISKILEDRFNEYKKDIPEFIEENDSYYGSYIIRPVVFISRDYYYDGMSKEEFRKILIKYTQQLVGNNSLN